MIKVMWNQCEAETKARGDLYAAMNQFSPSLIVQCDNAGEERVFADGHKAIMCATHWNICTGIVDKDGATHMRPADCCKDEAGPKAQGV
jgi:hypothetical protein